MGITLKQLSDTVQKVKSYVDDKVANTTNGSQVQADWTETDTSSASYIMNKPTIPETYDDTEIKDRLDTIENNVSANASADFLTSDGFGNLRYYTNVFQYYDTSLSNWVDIGTTQDNPIVMYLTPKSMESLKCYYDKKIKKICLTFKEPSDTVIDNQALCFVEKVIIRRKKDSVPADENDGDLVIEVPRKDFGSYKSSAYIDVNVSPEIGDIYYYRAFPVSTMGEVNNLEENQIAFTEIKSATIYGFKIDQNESDPDSMITYIEENENFTPVFMDYTTDTFNYGDWGDAWFMNIKPCMLNYDGTVAYYLNPNDYTLKEDGSKSDIEDELFTGNVMIEIPKIYWKIVDNEDDTASVYFSDTQLDEDYHCWSHLDKNGDEIDYCYLPSYNGYNDGTRLRSLSGKTPINSQTASFEIALAKANNVDDDVIWYTEVFSDRMLINLLLLLIGKSTDTQTVFGNGNYTGGNSTTVLQTGTLNNKGLFYGTNGTGKSVKIFGIENWWGNLWRRTAGWIVADGTQKIKLTYGQSDGSTADGYNTDGTGYISIGCTPNGTNGGYISKMTIMKYGLIPTTSDGSATTYYTDGLWYDNNKITYANTGGHCNYGFKSGALFAGLHYTITESTWTMSAALSCKPLAIN